RASGRTRLIGVSNFTVPLLREAVEVHKADLFCNQVEYHPFLAQPHVLSDVRKADMMLTAYLPLARGLVFQDPVLAEIGARHGKTAGQVSLRWLLQQENVIAIPKSGSVERLRENLDLFDFELDDDEMARIHALDRQDRRVDYDWAPDWDPL